MLFGERQLLAERVLTQAVWEAKYVLVVGSGLWFTVLEDTVTRWTADKFDVFVNNARVIPAYYGCFQNGGTVAFVDLETPGRALELFEQDVPDVLYLVEDCAGAHLIDWQERIQPFLRGSPCPVIVVGDLDAES